MRDSRRDKAAVLSKSYLHNYEGIHKYVISEENSVALFTKVLLKAKTQSTRLNYQYECQESGLFRLGLHRFFQNQFYSFEFSVASFLHDNYADLT